MKSNMLNLILWAKSKFNIMSMVTSCGLLLAFSNAQAQFTWPVYEPFGEYTNGTILGVTNLAVTPPVINAASPWWGIIGNGIGSSQPIVFDYEALSYPALVADTNNTPRGVSSASVTGSHDAAASFTAHAGTIYASFLINNINNQGTTFDRMFFSLNTGTSASGGFGMSVYLTTDYRLKIRKNPSGSPSGAFTDPTLPLTTNATHLVVIRYRTNSVAGAPDTVDLWLDPTPFGDAASIPTPTLTTTNGANVSASTFRLLVVPSRGAGLYTYYMDEIRLGDTWASVTPLATPAPGPLFTVTGGGIGCEGDIIKIGLSGSVTTNFYLLYTNGVYTGVTFPGTGSALDFGAQTTIGYYSVLASNTVTANIGWMSNSPAIALKASANIVTQPLPMTVATNNRAEFKISCTGDEVSYRWYKDGAALTNDSHITGVTTNDLVIWPASAADIGGYYCRVSDTCSHVLFSTTNALTLSAPNNLVWAGDAFNVDIWDVFAPQAEWSGGSGFFIPGDNVTFDDTYTFASSVTLNGVLTPTTLNVNASRNYSWIGTGFIAGTNSLVKSGSGTLYLSNNLANGSSNTYSGGTVINNGAVFVSGYFSLGTGPVTLAGGTLETVTKGSSTLGLPNDVFVTASSTWANDAGGNTAGTLMGTLNGGPGITLTISNSNPTINKTNQIALVAPFTNSLAIFLANSNNNPPIAMQLFLYNSNNAQIFNGAISGPGMLTKLGAGALYLNAANTYPGPTTNSLGLLAGSGSISGPLAVDPTGTLGGGSAAAIGTFTGNNTLSLNGNVFIRVNKSLVQSNDLISVTGAITNGGTGTVTMTNIGATALVVGDSFQLLSGAVSNGAVLAVTGGGVNWANNLAVNGSIQVSSIIASYPTNISYTISGGTLTLSWPATHLGWILQNQTNSLSTGIGKTWYDISNTASVTSTNIAVSPANPSVFYRLRHP